ncbi:histidine phosphatase family protein [Hahella sp. NBU794]|uniref:histidine phosphatase family protein n=1 Tax=Hahella sp. NBU794 TaxID=3422590 RepID=UPI003D6F1D6D
MKIHLIRHGQSKWQTGESASKDSALTELGVRQSLLLGGRLSAIVNDNQTENVFYSSPLIRSVQTVNAAGVNYSIATGLKEASFHVASELPGFAHPAEHERLLSDSQKYLYFRRTVESVFKQLTNNESKDVFLFTHGGVIKTILRVIHSTDTVCYKINNCSLTILTWRRSRWHLDALNECNHLPLEMVT